MGKHGRIHSGIPTPYKKQVPVIPFGNEQQYRGTHQTLYLGSSLKKDAIKTHQLKSQTKLPSKDKESTR